MGYIGHWLELCKISHYCDFTKTSKSFVPLFLLSVISIQLKKIKIKKILKKIGFAIKFKPVDDFFFKMLMIKLFHNFRFYVKLLEKFYERVFSAIKLIKYLILFHWNSSKSDSLKLDTDKVHTDGKTLTSFWVAMRKLSLFTKMKTNFQFKLPLSYFDVISALWD